jgi:hypothetical protein
MCALVIQLSGRQFGNGAVELVEAPPHLLAYLAQRFNNKIQQLALYATRVARRMVEMLRS